MPALWTWQNRAKQERGKVGLKIEPWGAMTLIGRVMPSFCGTKTGNATSSRKIIRVMNDIDETVVPSNGQL